MQSHSPVPDGKTGPWLRKPHYRFPDGTRAHDARCGRCITDYDNGVTTDEDVMRSYRERVR